MFRGSDTHHLIPMMRDKLAKLTAENSNASRKKMLHLKGEILPAIAAFKTLCSVMSEDEALDVMRGYIFDKAKRARKIYDKLMKIPGAYRLMSFAASQVMKRSFGEEQKLSAMEMTAVISALGYHRKLTFNEKCRSGEKEYYSGAEVKSFFRQRVKRRRRFYGCNTSYFGRNCNSCYL